MSDPSPLSPSEAPAPTSRPAASPSPAEVEAPPSRPAAPPPEAGADGPPSRLVVPPPDEAPPSRLDAPPANSRFDAPPADERAAASRFDGPSADEAAPASRPAARVEPHPRPSYVFLGVVSALSLVADLATKTWAERALQTAAETPTPKVVVKNLFTFLLAKNRGGAWGVLQNAPENVRKPFFVVVSVFAILFIVSLYRRLHPSQRALRWGLPLVLGGALGNLVDRIRYGYVIDFIDFQLTWGGASHHWPTFNVADIAICVGVALMAVDMLSPRRGHAQADATPPPAPSGAPAGGGDV